MKRTIKICFLFIVLIFSVGKINAQQLPIYSQYMFNEYLLNAAYSGTYNFTPVIFNHRNQWYGFGDSAPQTSSLSIHSPISAKSSIGTTMIYDQTNPISKTQIELSYGYRFMLSQKSNLRASMALSGTYNMVQFTRQENGTYSEMTEGIIDITNQMNETSTVADINFGIILYNDYFDGGISIRNLLAPEVLNSNPDDVFDKVKYLMIHASYFGLSNSNSPIGLIPSIVVRKMGIIKFQGITQADINLKLIYRNKIWTGISYRTHEKVFSPTIGFNTRKAFFGYSYDIGTSALEAYHDGSHNIVIGFKLAGNKIKNTRRQTPLYMDMDSEWKWLRISDMRNRSTP
jgi:type IX secretion system PorP/SprF family membrane protein